MKAASTGRSGGGGGGGGGSGSLSIALLRSLLGESLSLQAALLARLAQDLGLPPHTPAAAAPARHKLTTAKAVAPLREALARAEQTLAAITEAGKQPARAPVSAPVPAPSGHSLPPHQIKARVASITPLRRPASIVASAAASAAVAPLASARGKRKAAADSSKTRSKRRRLPPARDTSASSLDPEPADTNRQESTAALSPPLALRSSSELQAALASPSRTVRAPFDSPSINGSFSFAPLASPLMPSGPPLSARLLSRSLSSQPTFNHPLASPSPTFPTPAPFVSPQESPQSMSTMQESTFPHSHPHSYLQHPPPPSTLLLPVTATGAIGAGRESPITLDGLPHSQPIVQGSLLSSSLLGPRHSHSPISAMHPLMYSWLEPAHAAANTEPPPPPTTNLPSTARQRQQQQLQQQPTSFLLSSPVVPRLLAQPWLGSGSLGPAFSPVIAPFSSMGPVIPSFLPYEGALAPTPTHANTLLSQLPPFQPILASPVAQPLQLPLRSPSRIPLFHRAASGSGLGPGGIPAPSSSPLLPPAAHSAVGLASANSPARVMQLLQRADPTKRRRPSDAALYPPPLSTRRPSDPPPSALARRPSDVGLPLMSPMWRASEADFSASPSDDFQLALTPFIPARPLPLPPSSTTSGLVSFADRLAAVATARRSPTPQPPL